MSLDVVVIGASPAGSTAAREIAGQGWRVTLLERGERPGQHAVCGGGIEEIDAKEIGLPDGLVHKRIVRREHYFPWGVTTTTNPHVTTLRRELDYWLAEEAVAAGSELLTCTQVRAVARERTGCVMVTAEDRTRTRQLTYRGRLVIFADGPNTLAPRCANLGFVRTPVTASIGLVYELAWPDTPMAHYEVHFGGRFTPWGYVWAFPKRDLLSVGITVLPSHTASVDLEGRLKAFIAEGPDLRGRRIIRRIGAYIPVAPAKRVHDDSMLAVGDAAGMVDPLTGAGIAHAIMGGRLAGQVACEALQEGDFSADFLSRYESRWHTTSRYRRIRLQAVLTRTFLAASRFDSNLYAKLMQVLFLGGEVSRWQKIRVLAYPILKSQVEKNA